LEALTEACGRQATLKSRDLEKPDLDPIVRAEYESEMDFYELAAENLRLARVVIETDVRIRLSAIEPDIEDRGGDRY
jgi:hypothetical protein